MHFNVFVLRMFKQFGHGFVVPSVGLAGVGLAYMEWHICRVCLAEVFAPRCKVYCTKDRHKVCGSGSGAALARPE